MSLRQWFSLSQKIDSAVVCAIALTSFYFRVGWFVFVLSHAYEETLTPVAIVGIAGTLSSMTCAQDTPTFNLFFHYELPSLPSKYTHCVVCAICHQVFSTISTNSSWF